MHIKENESEFLNEIRLKSIVKKYSDHIIWPIEMQKPQEEGKDIEFDVINQAKAMWTQPKSALSDEDYKEFYKHIAHDISDPAIWSHNKVEEKSEYTSLLYIPTNAPFDINNREKQHGLHLYVQRVFIMDNAQQFLPTYLRFMRGLLDSSDLPLNISREILQSNPQVASLKSAITKKSLSLIDKLSKDKEKYKIFWREFGSILREGIVEDFANKDEIAKLLRFRTTRSKNDEDLFSFSDYVDRMDNKQDKIYLLIANSYNAAKNSPHLEIFNKQNIEVILFTDRIDEWVVNHLQDFGDKELQSITHGELTDEMVNDNNVDEEKSSVVIDKIKKILSDKVKNVRVSKRLTNSPACIVADDGEMSQEMLKLLQATGQPTPNILPILEINIDHPIIKKIEKENNDDSLSDLSNIVFDQAVLAEGGMLDDPGMFINRLNKLLSNVNI